MVVISSMYTELWSCDEKPSLVCRGHNFTSCYKLNQQCYNTVIYNTADKFQDLCNRYCLVAWDLWSITTQFRGQSARTSNLTVVSTSLNTSIRTYTETSVTGFQLRWFSRDFSWKYTRSHASCGPHRRIWSSAHLLDLFQHSAQPEVHCLSGVSEASYACQSLLQLLWPRRHLSTTGCWNKSCTGSWPDSPSLRE